MQVTDIDLIRRFIINAKTDKALEGLMRLVKSVDPKIYNRAILLYSEFNAVTEKYNLGLGTFSENKNRINLAILELLTELESTIEDSNLETQGKSDGNIEQRIKDMEEKVELILSIVERLHESPLHKFVRGPLFKLLNERTRNHLISLAAVETESEDYNFLISEWYVILELELMHAIFLPLKKEIGKELATLSKNEVYAKLEGDQKLQFYDFIRGEQEDLTLRQMSNLLEDNMNEKYNTKSKEYNFIFYFLLRNYVILDRWKLAGDFKLLTEEKVDKKLNTYIFSKFDYERVRNLIISILRNLQPKM